MNNERIPRFHLVSSVFITVSLVMVTGFGSQLYARQEPVMMNKEVRPTVKPSRPTGTVVTPNVQPGIVVQSPGRGKPSPQQPYRPPVVENKRPPKSKPPEYVVQKNDYHRKKLHRKEKYRRYHPPKYYGRVYRSLPSNVFSFYIGGTSFFYYSGIYYRQGAGGYVVVEAPIGARVRTLPSGCSYFYYNGDRCYACDDVFYREVGPDYVVIERPPRFARIVGVGDEVIITADSLNVRSGPGKQYRVTSQFYRGDIVEVKAIENGWYYVRFANRTYGWIMQEYTNPYEVYYDPKG